MADSRQARPRHESEDVDGRIIVWVVLSLIGILVVSGFIVFGLFTAFGGRLPESSTQSQPQAMENRFASPLELIKLVELRKEKLQRYGWINKEKRIIHVPIKFAMKWFAKEKEAGQVKRSSTQTSIKE